MIIIAHNIRSLYNVGAIFRNAAAFGVAKVYLTGITGTPPRKEIAKVALGAEELVPWETGKVRDVVAHLKERGYAVYGLDNAPGAISLIEAQSGFAKTPLCLVLGNEVDGIDQETKRQLDGLIEIPMAQKKSLNVSVASGIAMYAFRPR